MKKYKVGFYGSSFLPPRSCDFERLKEAAEECERVYLVCFINGIAERNLIQENGLLEEYTVRSRLIRMMRAAHEFRDISDIVIQQIDITGSITEDNTEDKEVINSLIHKMCGSSIDAYYMI